MGEGQDQATLCVSMDTSGLLLGQTQRRRRGLRWWGIPEGEVWGSSVQYHFTKDVSINLLF